jgi:hypothetical protein
LQVDYNKVEVQKLFLQMMLTNGELYTRVMNIMNADNFDKSIRPAAEFIKEYSGNIVCCRIKHKSKQQQVSN